MGWDCEKERGKGEKKGACGWWLQACTVAC